MNVCHKILVLIPLSYLSQQQLHNLAKQVKIYKIRRFNCFRSKKEKDFFLFRFPYTGVQYMSFDLVLILFYKLIAARVQDDRLHNSATKF